MFNFSILPIWMTGKCSDSTCSAISEDVTSLKYCMEDPTSTDCTGFFFVFNLKRFFSEFCKVSMEIPLTSLEFWKVQNLSNNFNLTNLNDRKMFWLNLFGYIWRCDLTKILHGGSNFNWLFRFISFHSTIYNVIAFYWKVSMEQLQISLKF